MASAQTNFAATIAPSPTLPNSRSTRAIAVEKSFSGPARGAEDILGCSGERIHRKTGIIGESATCRTALGRRDCLQQRIFGKGCARFFWFDEAK